MDPPEELRLLLCSPFTTKTSLSVRHPQYGRCVSPFIQYKRNADFFFLFRGGRPPDCMNLLSRYITQIRNMHQCVKRAPLCFYELSSLPFLRCPKTYPNLAGPVFTLEKLIKGLSDAQATNLSHKVNLEVQMLRGSEMVFTVRLESCIPLLLVLILGLSRL